jgi:hypothetical protein
MAQLLVGQGIVPKLEFNLIIPGAWPPESLDVVVYIKLSVAVYF